MKLYINVIDNNKTLSLYRIKYSVTTLRNRKVDCSKYFIGYEEDINDNLDIVNEFYRYLNRLHSNRGANTTHLGTKVNSVNYLKDLNVSTDKNGMYLDITTTDDIRNVLFSDDFYFVKNVVKVG